MPEKVICQIDEEVLSFPSEYQAVKALGVSVNGLKKAMRESQECIVHRKDKKRILLPKFRILGISFVKVKGKNKDILHVIRENNPKEVFQMACDDADHVAEELKDFGMLYGEFFSEKYVHEGKQRVSLTVGECPDEDEALAEGIKLKWPTRERKEVRGPTMVAEM